MLVTDQAGFDKVLGVSPQGGPPRVLKNNMSAEHLDGRRAWRSGPKAEPLTLMWEGQTGSSVGRSLDQAVLQSLLSLSPQCPRSPLRQHRNQERWLLISQWTVHCPKLPRCVRWAWYCAVVEGEIEMCKEQGPVGLAGIQSLSGPNIFQVFMVYPHKERLFGPLQPLLPLL